eukprot:TRINITY_DN3295_c0_g1_i2.p1 TRINITY_DN3295_c0_g1~~TRINITY_DN3295_c0_g1_i2.p1  ORF type:complete len:151 (+),score=14.44 TRINITY_DN3295_c0_g1_i2:25-477(+)
MSDPVQPQQSSVSLESQFKTIVALQLDIQRRLADMERQRAANDTADSEASAGVSSAVNTLARLAAAFEHDVLQLSELDKRKGLWVIRSRQLRVDVSTVQSSLRMRLDERSLRIAEQEQERLDLLGSNDANGGHFISLLLTDSIQLFNLFY